MKAPALPAFYSQVLLQVASKYKSEESDLHDLQNVMRVLEQNQELHYLLIAPVSSRHEKRRILERLFDKKVGEHILSFLGKLTDQDRLEILPEIIDEFNQALQKQKGLIDVKLIVPNALDDKNKAALKAKLQATFGDKLELQEKVDSQIIGGLILQFPNNKILDYSLKTRLNRLRSALK